MKLARISLFTLAALASGCLTSVAANPDGGPSSGDTKDAGPAGDPTTNPNNTDAITYRDVQGHPGCTTDGLSTRPAGATNANSYTATTSLQGYQCAAKEYPVQNEDKTKPVILLVHGNSSTPADFETYADPNIPGTPMKMLSERLVDAGFRVFAVDGRFDKVNDPNTNNTTENAAKNMDHGWYVPLVEHFIDSAINTFPDRQISIVSFSLGPTTVRDALRRLHRAGKKPFEHIKDLVYASGANHGVSSYAKLCGSNPTMRGKVACEMGDRDHYQQTAFLKPLNGTETVDGKGYPIGDFETPCLDGNSAYGQSGVCGGHKVRYTTIVMMDPPGTTLQDEFVSQRSAALNGANNLTVGLQDYDQSNYFVGSKTGGAFKDHYGSIRSENGLTQVMGVLTAN